MMRPAKKQKVERRGVVEWEPTDAMLWDPHTLVDKHVRVLWPGEGRYFPGTVVKYCSATFEHEIHYDDGDQETLILATEKVKVLPVCLGALRAPSPTHLSALACHLDSLADNLEAKVIQQRTARGRTMIKEEDRLRLEVLRRRAADARAAKEQREHLLALQKQQRNEQRQLRSTPLPRQRGPARTTTPRDVGRASRTTRSAAVGEEGAAVAGSKTCAASSEQLEREQPDEAIPADSSAQCGAAVTEREEGEQQQQQQQGQEGAPSGATCRVCSPASAKRRQRLLRSAKQEDVEGAAGGSQAATSVSLIASPIGNPHLTAAADKRDATQGHSGLSSKLTATAWGLKARGGRAAAGADGDIGGLYVPRPWPKMRAVACDASSAPGGTALGAPAAVAEDRPPQQLPDAAGPDSRAGACGDEGQAEQRQDAATGEDVDPAAAAGAGPKAAGDGNSDGDRLCASAAAAAELRETYMQFRRSCSGFKQYHELQVALWLSPQQLVGREIRVLWPDEDAWFCGRVTRFDADAGTHTVEYDDGDVEHLHLAAESVRLQVVPGEAEAGLAPRPPAELQRVAACMVADGMRLRERAGELQARRQQGKGKRPTGQAAGQADDEDPDELVDKAERLCSRAAQLQALAALMLRDPSSNPVAYGADPDQQQQPNPNLGAPSLTTQPSDVGLLDALPGPRAGAHNEPATCGAVDDAATAAAATAGSGEEPAAPCPAADAPPSSDVANAAPGNVDGDPARSDEPRPGDDAGCSGGTASVPTVDPEWLAAQVFQPGEVVWAQVRRATAWPAIIITREEAEREGLSLRGASASQHVFVRFFGDHTVCNLPAVGAGQRFPERGSVVPFLLGLSLGWHTRRADSSGRGAASGVSAHAQRFLRALFELRAYMLEGELPRGMIPPNNDEDDDEYEDAGADGGANGALPADPSRAKAGAARASAGPAAGGSLLSAVTLPLVVNPKLTVLRLGEVVWLSRWFHDEKYIYPVGYCAARMMASGASGGREVRHVMEVVASEDGARPVFRITPDGRPPVSADTASRAMRALFEDDVRASGRAFAKTGADLFGLSSSRVAALVRSLPGAERCERFANWPDNEKPPVPPLTPFEELQRRALYARSLRLPPGVTPLQQAKSGMCFECEVCGEDEESPDDLKLECDMCRCVVHTRCYGVPQPPHGGLWLCDVCQLHAAGLPTDRAPPCELCPYVGGPMKRTEGGGYVHLLCAVWTPGVTFGDADTLEPVEGVNKAVQARSSLRCFLCKQAHGACIQCAADARCYKAFHPMCAREAGLAMCELRRGAAARRQPPRPEPAAADRAQEPDGLLRPPSGEDCTHGAEQGRGVGKENKQPEDTNAAGAPAPGDKATASAVEPIGGQAAETAATAALTLEAQACTAITTATTAITTTTTGVAIACAEPAAGATAAAAAASQQLQRRGRRRGRPSRHARLDSAACLGGVSLGNGISLACFCPRHEDLVLNQPHFRTSYPGGRFAERRAELTRAQLRERRERLLHDHELNQSAPQQQQQQQQPPQLLPPPEKEAQEDRTQVQGAAGPRAQVAGELSSGEQPTGRAMSFADWRSRGHRAPEAIAIAREKRTFVRQVPYLVTGRLQQDEQAVQAARRGCGVVWEQEQDAGDTGAHAGASADPVVSGVPGGDFAAEALAAADGGAGDRGAGGASALLPPELATAAVATGARSVAERYAAMRSTVGQRLAVGKSAIHGWGAFAKVPHKRGDMVIEYVGELIRPSVSDVREKRVYDKLVGCGTYIFNLNETQHIDATRAGNMAHLLNHSCEPNCYSRTITLWDAMSGTTQDHVIITAKRDLEAWEELTYDYRFNSAVDLPCNCGAATCRLLVNWPEQPDYGDGPEDEEEEQEDGVGGAGCGEAMV